MEGRDRWWELQEQPFRATVPVVGRLIVWFRRAWNNVATRWYVLPLVQQQNEINRRLLVEMERLQEEINALQATQASLDREATDRQREAARALYALRADLERVTGCSADLKEGAEIHKEGM